MGAAERPSLSDQIERFNQPNNTEGYNLRNDEGDEYVEPH
jgi:hypothetical protein